MSNAILFFIGLVAFCWMVYEPAKVEEIKPDLEEGECPDCFEYGHDIRSHCRTCYGTGWVTPTRSGWFYKSINMPEWAKRKP